MNENLFGKIQKFENRAQYQSERMAGVNHHNRIHPQIPRPNQDTEITVTVEESLGVDRVECILLKPIREVILFERKEVVWDALNWAYYEVWKATVPGFPEDTKVCYQINAHLRESCDLIPADRGEIFSYIIGEMAPPDWAREAIVYQIFPDRFHPGKGRDWKKHKTLRDIYGGTIRGILDNLEHVIDLGFNTIWLNPFFPSDSHHGYNATDYFSVDPRMGTVEDIRELVERCHQNDIRLILDFVANHWGRKHPIFQAAQKERQSDYYNWFSWREWPHNYEAYFDIKELPKINLVYPAARQHLMDSVRFWLGEIGFDGLRLDHANGPVMDFWTELRQVAQSVKPDVWIFGEVVLPADRLRAYEGRFHGCLDFPMVQILRDTFGFGTRDVAEFDAFLERNSAYYPSYLTRPLFLDNHDMDRFGFLVGGDTQKIKTAALCLFTLKEPPIVYYGTEVGVPQYRSKSAGLGWEEGRQPMLWGNAQDRDLYEYFKWLVSFRKQHPVIWKGARQTVHINEGKGTYAYDIQDGKEEILVGFNLSAHARTFHVDLPDSQKGYEFSLPPWDSEAVILER
jgi:glycosidase